MQQTAEKQIYFKKTIKMKHLHTFESFLNETLNEGNITLQFDETSQIIKPTSGNPDPSMPRFEMNSRKKGWVYAADGSIGTESRIIVKCNDSEAEKVFQAAVQEFTGKTWNNWDSMKKEVSDFLKKSC